MTQDVHFDEAKILAALDKQAAQIIALADKNGSPAVLRQARMTPPVLRQFLSVFIQEINRGASSQDLVIPIANVVANILTTFATSVATGDSKVEAAVLQSLMEALCFDLDQHYGGGGLSSETMRVRAEQGGRA